ncbi:MAG: phosphoribosylformylglycinamidine synthase subunit PurS [Saprospiraceae bacterium]|nr:phosphoribosylformylglycinamidine synthase subunit PurS [Saprospiraceae bacterium]
MKFKAHIVIMPLKELLDPQGKTVAKNMSNVDVHGVEDVRIGKSIEVTLEATSEKEAREKVEKACSSLLANPIMESYRYDLESLG